MATRNKFLKTGDLAMVMWLDACSEDEWKETSETEVTPAEIMTVGICMEHNEDHILMALNHDPVNDAWSCKISIPTGMIVKTKKLR